MSKIRSLDGICLLGYGNTLREDDGLGPACIVKIEKDRIPGVTTITRPLLTPDDAFDIGQSDVVIFVDALLSGNQPYIFKKVEPLFELTICSSLYSPETIMATSVLFFGKKMRGYLLGIRGYQWGFSENLSSGASANLDMAYRFIRDKIFVTFDPGSDDSVSYLDKNFLAAAWCD